MRSASSSMPTEMRTSSPGTSSAEPATETCVMVAGCSSRLSTPPRDSARQNSLVDLQKVLACSVVWNSTETMPPKRVICFAATSWPGWVSRPG